MADRPQDVVARGYDAMADRFAVWKARIRGMTAPQRARELVEFLPQHPVVLELACGGGSEETRLLAEQGRLVGVDISAEQLRRARERIPNADFVQADLTEVAFEPASFDAVVSSYAFNHIPREALGSLLAGVARWLGPGGYLLATFAAGDQAAWRGEWLGVEMFFSGYPPERTLKLVCAAGLNVVRDELETIVEPEGPVEFFWVLARRPE